MRHALLIGFAFAALGCASGSGTAGNTAAGAATAAKPRPRSQDVITADEIAESEGAGTAYEFISRSRPSFLRSSSDLLTTGAGLAVRVDGRLSSTDELKSLYLRDIVEIRYFTANEAITRFGGSENGPVIAVTLRHAKK